MRILGDRYRLEEPIGGGGMALVYRAQDTVLGRTVAVKMLRMQYAGDEEFVRRFRQESQSAARLSHPNIVRVYDMGVEDDEYYIVMEYVDGPTLKDLIIERAPLPVDLVVDIATQICAALEHAHEQHIVHRDIKPHNILLTQTGTVKVVDFGIARAVTGNTITDRQATSVMGSVHYISPEQARGGSTDFKSDIYSLGVVMYEMLTNRLPFSGDSPVSVALKHLRDRFIEPRELNRQIPQSVENIVLKCLVKSPNARYQNMAAVQADLQDALAHPNVPKFIMPNEVFDETIAIPAIGGHVIQPGQESKQNQKKKRPWWMTLIWAIVAIAMVGVALYAAYNISMYFMQVPNENLPNVVGKTEQQALATLKAAGFPANQIQEVRATNSKPSGTVYDQNPEGPTTVKRGREITLYVSSGAPQVQVPSLNGVVEADAIQQLINQGFARNNIKIVSVQSTQVPTGQVVSSVPAAGSSVNTNTKIVLQVSEGSVSTVPSLIGMTYAQAVQALQAANLQVGQVTKQSFSAPDQTVFKIGPYNVGDSVPSGTAINLYIANNSGNSTGSGNGSGGDGSSGNGSSGNGSSPNLPTGTHTHQVAVSVNDNSGQTMQVSILVTDATGSNVQVVNQTITQTTSWNVTVQVAPGTTGTVQLVVNGQQVQSQQVNY